MEEGSDSFPGGELVDLDFAVEAGGGTRRPRRSRRGNYPMGTLELGTWELDIRRNGYKNWEGEIVLQPGRERDVRIVLERRE